MTPTKTRLKTTRLALAASALALTGTMASADQVINDDLIVIGSACVGVDCTNGLSFGFDTLILKENNLRLLFDDTSVSASFPKNDWRFIANDSSNGGGNYMAIEDATAGRQVFRVEAGARANALTVDSGGDVGIGLLNAVVNIHVREGNTPTLRLEQDGSSGFTPQTFDVAANEANFFIRDVTNGSQLPFKIKPGADTGTFFMSATNEIGIGTESPKTKLHVSNGGAAYAAGGGDDMVVQDDGPARLVLVNTAATNPNWVFNSNDTLRISAGTDDAEMELQSNGNLNLDGTCIEFDANTANRFACTFAAGGTLTCSAAGSSCP